MLLPAHPTPDTAAGRREPARLGLVVEGGFVVDPRVAKLLADPLQRAGEEPGRL